jgi:2-oxoglutarate ferredoxin oxidoreductase subunit alpha
MSVELIEGSEAIARAMVSAGCRFFAGYPMTPFTEVLEGMAKELPKVGGVCMNAESELEAIGMAWGAASTGARAATGSVGQGLSLMQESLAEMCFAKLPLVCLNMARGQGDYFQATRGGGHGDYRHIVLAPCDLKEAVHLIQYAFHLADMWRNPVMFMGDYYLAHVQETVDTGPIDFGPLEPKDWALDGSSSGHGSAKIVSPIMPTKRDAPEPINYGQYLGMVADSQAVIAAGVEALAETGYTEGAELIMVAYGTPGRIVRYVVKKLREEGYPVGFVRPITLWPFPAEILREACRDARAIAVHELNSGQMIDDVSLSVRHLPVFKTGGVSMDESGFGIAPDLTPTIVRERILATLSNIREQAA